MSVMVQKVPGRSVGSRLVELYLKSVQTFMDFADVGFRYIDIPVENLPKRPKKKIKAAKFERYTVALNPSFQF